MFVFQVFLIIHYQPLVNALADVILNGDLSVFSSQKVVHSTHKSTVTHTHMHTSCTSASKLLCSLHTNVLKDNSLYVVPFPHK